MAEPRIKNSVILRAAAALASLGLITWGLAWIYPPLGPLGLGGILWLEFREAGHHVRTRMDRGG